MILRKFNSAGIQEFSKYLNDLGIDPTLLVPEELLVSPLFTLEVSPNVVIEKQIFSDRLECAKHLHKALAPVSSSDLMDAGLWAWMSLFYFDVVCPSTNGRRYPGERARHIPQMTNYRRFYRHLLLNPLTIYSAHKDELHNVLAVLSNPVHKPGEISEQLASRQELITNKGILRLATDLYFDRNTKRVKTGAGGKSGGSARRLAIFINQIDLTYDLYEINPAYLLSILPREFDKFRQ